MKHLFLALIVITTIGCNQPGSDSKSQNNIVQPVGRLQVYGDHIGYGEKFDGKTQDGYAYIIGRELGMEVVNHSLETNGSSSDMVIGEMNVNTSDVGSNDIVIMVLGLGDVNFYGADQGHFAVGGNQGGSADFVQPIASLLKKLGVAKQVYLSGPPLKMDAAATTMANIAVAVTPDFVRAFDGPRNQTLVTLSTVTFNGNWPSVLGHQQIAESFLKAMGK